MYEILIHLAELLGGAYTLLPDSSIMADDMLGAIAGCGQIDPEFHDICASAAIDAWIGE